MNIPSTFKKALIGAAVATLASAPAFAANVTYTQVQPSVGAPQGAVFQLQQFDPSLGTLEQVDLTWNTTVSVNAQITQNGAGSANLFDAGVAFSFNAPSVVILQNNVPTFLFAWPANTPSPYVVAPSAPALVGNGQQINQANWAAYVVDGFGPDTFDVTWQIADFSNGAGPVWVGVDGFQGATLDDRLGGYNFSVTYNYEPAAVPEPGSLALLALGGLALVSVRRRRKA